MSSPWGQIDQSTQIETGVRWVSTPSHGGLMVTRAIAAKKLSPRAIACAFPGQTANHVCFEEDCSYLIAFYEHPEWARFLDEKSLSEWQQSTDSPDSYMGKAKLEAIPRLEARLALSVDQFKAETAEQIKHWNPEYFAEQEKTSV